MSAPDPQPTPEPNPAEGWWKRWSNNQRAAAVGISVLVVVALIAIFTGGGEPQPEKTTVLTDGQESQPIEKANPRQEIWKEPIVIFAGADDSIDRYAPAITDGGLTLVFVAGLPKSGDSGADLYISTRAKPTDEWSDPKPLTALNTDSDEIGPAFSFDGQFLLFASNREGGQGGYDLWVSRNDDGNWSAPVNLGASINTPMDELDPFIRRKLDEPGNTGDRLHPAGLYYASNQPAEGEPEANLPRWRGTARLQPVPQSENFDLFLARIESEAMQIELDPEVEPEAETEEKPTKPSTSIVGIGDLLSQLTGGGKGGKSAKTAPSTHPWTFAQPERLVHLNTAARDAMPALTQLGDYIYYASNREAGLGGFDILSARWHPESHRTPQPIGAPVNSPDNDTDPVLFAQGHHMIFSSDRGGSGDEPTYQLFATHTTPVIPVEHVADIAPRESSGGGFWGFLHDNWLWILLLLLAPRPAIAITPCCIIKGIGNPGIWIIARGHGIIIVSRDFPFQWCPKVQ